ncbi:MAG: hypothetical protein AAFR98_04145 [Pseudomonadota bacterium]
MEKAPRNRWLRREDGGPTVEFVVLFIPLMVAFYWVFDTGWLGFQVVQLDRGVEFTTRELMISDITQDMTDEEAHAFLKAKVCDTGFIANCEDNLVLDIQQFDDYTTAFDTSLECVDRTDEIEPVYQYSTIDAGGCTTEAEIVIFRACLLYDPLLPPGLTMYEGERKNDGAIEIRSTSAFVNEPC